MLVNTKAVTVGLWVRLEAKPGRATDLEAFLRGAAPLAQAEPATPVWFAIRLGRRHSASLTRFLMKPVVRRTWPVALPPRSVNRHRHCSPHHP